MQKRSSELAIFYSKISFIFLDRKKVWSKYLIFCIFLMAPIGLQAQAESLINADSLFKSGKYTQAYKEYDSLFRQGQFSAQMLMKMAFMQEEAEQFAKAIYYLSVCKQQFPNIDVEQKINELVEKGEYLGYKPSDFELAVNFLNKNRFAISVTGTVLLLAGFGLLFWLKKRNSDILAPSILLGAYAIIFLLLINYHPSLQAGILQSEDTLLMEAPSAGSDVIDRLGAGHKLQILDKYDIWYQVKWQGEIGFIRESNIWLLNK